MFKQTKQKNGLKLITIPMTGTKTVTVLVMIGTGSKYEGKKNNGISHFLEHMFFKGTTKRPTALSISSALDSIGAEYNAFTGKEYTGYWIKAEAAKINFALEIVSDMLFNPLLVSEEIEREKGVIIEELNMYYDNPMMYIEDLYENLLYGDTPAGWDTIGTKKNIAGFKRLDFVNYLNSQYGAKNTIVCLAGNLPKSLGALSGRINKHFSTKQLAARNQNFQEKVPVVEKQIKPQIKMHYKATDQAHLSLGLRAFGFSHQDKIILNLLAVILGGSMSSRLFINLRERAGLAYYVRTNAEIYTDSGYLTTRAGVPVNKIDQAIKIILNEYQKIKTTLVTGEELKRAKDLFKGRLRIQLEASDDVAEWYGRQLILLDTIRRTADGAVDKILSPEKFIVTLNKISAQDIRRVAKNIFVNRGLNLAVVGPYKGNGKFEKILKI